MNKETFWDFCASEWYDHAGRNDHLLYSIRDIDGNVY